MPTCSTTMVYTHVLNRGGRGVVSPLTIERGLSGAGASAGSSTETAARFAAGASRVAVFGGRRGGRLAVGGTACRSWLRFNFSSFLRFFSSSFCRFWYSKFGFGNATLLDGSDGRSGAHRRRPARLSMFG